jgi:enoyl-CoA hydratase
MYNNLLTQVQDGILTITINRETKLNALNIETLGEIKQAIAEAQTNADVAGIIITGAGPKAFVAGADISEFANFNQQQGTEMAANGHAIFNSIEHSKKPVIAAINGFALGGGCELAMACHIRVASENAKFGQPEVNLGIIPGYAGTQRLIQLIGKGKALELLMTADVISAAEALNLGLVNHVVALDELMNKCVEILNKIKAKSPVAIAHVIDCVNAHHSKDKPGFDREVQLFGESFNTNDFKEGTTAFMEKRKAEFKGN